MQNPLVNSDKEIQPLKTTKEMFQETMSLAIPISTSTIIAFLVEGINLFFVGHLKDPAYVAGVGLANMCLNILFLTTFLGINSTMQAFVSQSLGNDPTNLRMCGIYLNRGRIIVLGLCVINVIISLNFNTILQSLGVEPVSSQYCQTYALYLLPGMIFYSQYDAQRALLSAYGHPMICVIIQVITMILHTVLCYVTLFKFELPFYWTGINLSICHFLNFAALTVYLVAQDKYKSSIFFPDKESFTGLLEFLKIGLPAVGMFVFDIAFFEYMTLLSSQISVVANATQTIVLNTNQILYMLPYGFSIAIITLIGKSIGEGNVAQGKRYQKFFQLLVILTGIVSSLSIYFSRYYLTVIYTSIPEIEEMCMKIFQFMAVCFFNDTIQGLQQGIMRGLSKTFHASINMFLAYYCVSAPCAYILGIKLEMGLKGLWTGLFIGQILMITLNQVLISIVYDWEKIALEAKLRSQADMDKVKLSNEKQINAKCIEMEVI